MQKFFAMCLLYIEICLFYNTKKIDPPIESGVPGGPVVHFEFSENFCLKILRLCENLDDPASQCVNLVIMPSTYLLTVAKKNDPITRQVDAQGALAMDAIRTLGLVLFDGKPFKMIRLPDVNAFELTDETLIYTVTFERRASINAPENA